MVAGDRRRPAAAGPGWSFEFEQILPGQGDPDHNDAIIEAMELRDRGDAAPAIELLGGLLEPDARWRMTANLR
jgi:hypothetical protein